jgi:hypothetical protein
MLNEFDGHVIGADHHNQSRENVLHLFAECFTSSCDQLAHKYCTSASSLQPPPSRRPLGYHCSPPDIIAPSRHCSPPDIQMSYIPLGISSYTNASPLVYLHPIHPRGRTHAKPAKVNRWPALDQGATSEAPSPQVSHESQCVPRMCPEAQVCTDIPLPLCPGQQLLVIWVS